jgi:hypothetical protein
MNSQLRKDGHKFLQKLPEIMEAVTTISGLTKKISL